MGIKSTRPGGADAGRGDDPHAMPNAVSSWEPADFDDNFYVANIAEDIYFDHSDQSATEEELNDDYWLRKLDDRQNKLHGTVSQLSNKRWLASLYRPTTPYEDLYGAEDPYEYEKDFRTERRAKIAVEAMLNRRNEGRDEKTGRKPADTWPIKGSPY